MYHWNIEPSKPGAHAVCVLRCTSPYEIGSYFVPSPHFVLLDYSPSFVILPTVNYTSLKESGLAISCESPLIESANLSFTLDIAHSLVATLG
jgi:hypothetical protein